MLFVRLTSLAVYLLGSPVEIHLAGGERVSARLGRGGRSGGMLMAHRQSRGSLLRAQAAAVAAAAAAPARGSSFSRLDGGGNIMKGSFSTGVKSERGENGLLPVSAFKIKHTILKKGCFCHCYCCVGCCGNHSRRNLCTGYVSDKNSSRASEQKFFWRRCEVACREGGQRVV